MVNDADLIKLMQSLAECRCITKVAPRYDDPVWHLPPKLLDDLNHNRFLAFQTERIDRVQHINAEMLCHLPHQCEVTVKIRVNLNASRPVCNRLCQLAHSNLLIL